MTVWIDAMLSPALARWMTDTFDGVEAYSLDHLDLRHAADGSIRAAALDVDAVVLTKDHGFADAVRRDPTQPSVLWVRVGNTTTAAMKALLTARLPASLDAIREGVRVVEFHDVDA